MTDVFELDEVVVEVAERPLLDRAAGLAEGLPVGHLVDDRPALAADRLGGLAHVAAELGVAQGEPGRVLEADGGRGRQRLDVARHQLGIRRSGSAHARSSAASDDGVVASVDARISARWTVPTPARWRCRAPPMCIRHELSAAAQNSAPGVEDAADLVAEHGHRRVGVLDGERAAEPAALLGPGQLDQVDPPDRPQQPQRGVADAEHPQRVAGRVIRHPVRVIGADVLDPQLVDEELRELEHPAATAARPRSASPGSPASSAACGYISRTIPTHEADGETTTSASPKTSTNCRTSGIASR